MSYFEDRNYGCDTVIRVSRPHGMYMGGKVLCSDGKVRALNRIATASDTFFSVPAQVKVGRKTVSGYVTFETARGLSTPTPDDPVVAKFCAYAYGKNGHLLPGGTWQDDAKALQKGAA